MALGQLHFHPIWSNPCNTNTRSTAVNNILCLTLRLITTQWSSNTLTGQWKFPGQSLSRTRRNCHTQHSTEQHRTVLIIFPLILQTIITAQTMSTEVKGSTLSEQERPACPTNIHSSASRIQRCRSDSLEHPLNGHPRNQRHSSLWEKFENFFIMY